MYVVQNNGFICYDQVAFDIFKVNIGVGQVADSCYYFYVNIWGYRDDVVVFFCSCFIICCF